MAKRKKAKSKAKKAKKTKKKAAARKAAGRKKPTAKKAPKAKAKKAKAKAKARKAKKAKAKPKAARKPAAAVQPVSAAPPAPAEVPPGDRVGTVTHYYSHLSVAIVQLETGSLRVGEMVRIKGHTSDFIQPVESMEIDHVHVNEAHAGQTLGLRVKEHAREHDVVYKLAQ